VQFGELLHPVVVALGLAETVAVVTSLAVRSPLALLWRRVLCQEIEQLHAA
jgi:hypothetical protein